MPTVVEACVRYQVLVSFAKYNCLRYPDRQNLWRKLEIISLDAYFAVAVKRVLERDTKGPRSFFRTVGASSRYLVKKYEHVYERAV